MLPRPLPRSWVLRVRVWAQVLPGKSVLATLLAILLIFLVRTEVETLPTLAPRPLARPMFA